MGNTKFYVHKGTVRGEHHRDTDNQDGVTSGQIEVNGEIVNWGVVLDGCSAGLRSSSGVMDALDFIERTLPDRLKRRTKIDEVPDEVIMYDLIEYIELVAVVKVLGKEGTRDFLDGKIDLCTHLLRDEIAAYIRAFYLFTVFGFIQTPTKTYVFYRGDGAIRINDACTYHPQNNAALYPGYFAIPWSVPPIATAQRSMQVWELDTSSVDLVILGTDSWFKHRDLFETLPRFVKTNDRWLQRRLILWSQDESDDTFPSDSSIQESIRMAFWDDTSAIALISERYIEMINALT